MNFKKGLHNNQELIIPKKPSDYLPSNHLSRTVFEIVDLLSLDTIISKYSKIGQNAYNPRMMIKIIFYGYCISIRSSRKISNGCEERFDFVYLAGNLKPSHDRISDFRKENLEELKQIFQDIVLIGCNLGVANFGNIKTSIDGSKVKANASSKLTKDESGLNKMLERIESEIDTMFDEAKEIDNIEDKKYGKNNRGDELPKKLQSKESRKKAVEQAYDKLRKQKEEMRNKIIKEKKRDLTQTEIKKIEKMKMNVTDNDAKYMKQRNGVIKSNYNVQASVDEKNQFIIANDVTMECNDHHQLIPMIKETINNISEIPKQVKADNGYHAELYEAKELFSEIDFYVDNTNRRKDYINFYELKQKYTKTEYENLIKIVSPEGEKEYRKRMHTVEPVFGNLKYNLGYREFLLRGIVGAKGEFNLMCIAHNLKKIKTFLTKSGTNLAIALSEITINIKNQTKNKISVS